MTSNLQYPATVYLYDSGGWVSAGMAWIDDEAHAREMFAPFMAAINTVVRIEWKDGNSLMIRR